MTWWGWLILGAVLFGAELFAIDAQFYLVFLGISAALVGLLDLAGVTLPEWGQWLLFSILALISMFTFRKSLYEKIRGNVPGFRTGVAGETLVVPADLGSGESIRASFRGSNWTIVNDGAEGISAGANARIVRSDGLTLFVTTAPPDPSEENEDPS